MTKRAKLNLVTNQQNAKKQAASFDSDVENTGSTVDEEPNSRQQDASAVTASASSRQKFGGKSSQNNLDDVSAAITPRLKGKVLLKAAIIVGVTVAAVAVYLYKRRLIR